MYICIYIIETPENVGRFLRRNKTTWLFIGNVLPLLSVRRIKRGCLYLHSIQASRPYYIAKPQLFSNSSRKDEQKKASKKVEMKLSCRTVNV